MRIRIDFKTPDALDYAMREIEDCDPDRAEEAKQFIEQYVKYEECVSLIFDIDNKTVEVSKNNGRL